jgi:hypothetical protein
LKKFADLSKFAGVNFEDFVRRGHEVGEAHGL